MTVARRWTEDAHFAVWSDLPATERSVVGFFDPTDDLGKRMAAWGYQPGWFDLSDLTRFAAGLAQAESSAWAEGRYHIATRAYAERRFLVGDRVLHWAVPWLLAVARSHVDRREEARTTAERLLALGDALRPAPALSGSEGLVVPGFDGFGPLEPDAPMHDFLMSLWSGSVLLAGDLSRVRHARLVHRTLDRGWLGDRATRSGLIAHYLTEARRWDALAAAHPGTAQLWRDLSNRAASTARRLTA